MSIKQVLCWIGKVILGILIIIVISILGGIFCTLLGIFIAYMLQFKAVLIALSLIILAVALLVAVTIGDVIFREYGICKHFK